jgi:hypothetical protein
MTVELAAFEASFAGWANDNGISAEESQRLKDFCLTWFLAGCYTGINQAREMIRQTASR